MPLLYSLSGNFKGTDVLKHHYKVIFKNFTVSILGIHTSGQDALIAASVAHAKNGEMMSVQLVYLSKRSAVLGNTMSLA